MLDATAHALKFAGFQEKYFLDSFEPEFEIVPKKELQNGPISLSLPDSVPSPARGKLGPEEFQRFVEYSAAVIAGLLELKPLR